MAPTDDAFFREAESQIRTLTDGLIALERGDEKASVAELFRVAHSLKGSCRTQGLAEAGELAHAIEDVLDAIRAGEVRPTPELVDEALEILDRLEATVEAAAMGDEPEGDADATLISLRDRLDAERARTPADAPEGLALDGPTDAEADWEGDDLSDDVVAALEETTEFDDIDGLLEQMDDDEEDDDLDGWGLLDGEETDEGPTPQDVGAPDSSGPVPEDPSSAEPTSAERQSSASHDAAETPENPSAFFEETKAQIDEDGGIDDLQSDIDEVEFGEFDDEDTLTIEELMELEPEDDESDAEGEVEPETDPDEQVAGAETDSLAPEADEVASSPGDESQDESVDPLAPAGAAESTEAGETTAEAEDVTTPEAEDATTPEAGDASTIDAPDQTTADSDSKAESAVESADSADRDSATSADSDSTDLVDPEEDVTTFVFGDDEGDSESADPETADSAEADATDSVESDPTDSATADTPDSTTAGSGTADSATANPATADPANPGESEPTLDSDDAETEPGRAEASEPEFDPLAGLDSPTDSESESSATSPESDEAGPESVESVEADADPVSADSGADPTPEDSEPVTADESAEETDADTVPEADTVPAETTDPEYALESDPEVESDSEAESDTGAADDSTPADDSVPDADSVPDVDLGVELTDGVDDDLSADFEDDFADDFGADFAADLDEDSTGDTEADDELGTDLDSDLGADLDTDFDADVGGLDADAAGASDMAVSVDEEMAEFESRFDDLLGGGSGGDEEGDEGAVFRSAVGTIEESRLDADEFATGGIERDAEQAREFDRLQSMTVDVDTADRLLNVAEELSLTHLRLDEAVGPETDEAIREEVANLLGVVTEYRQTVMDVRLMALETALDTIPRTVRDVARSQDKEVELVVDDTDVELDRSIVDRLRDPLVHLARNAVDHGIEPPDEREAAGKSREGTVEIRGERVGDEVVVELSDDGRGIDPETIRRRAVAQGVCSQAEAERLTDEETFDLLFEPGFTTSDEVTDVSGRGVGMDAVQRTVADLNGSVTIESDSGEGTTVRLRVPVSIALTEVLFVEVGDWTFGLPMRAVEQITPAPPIETEAGRDVVRRSDLDLVGNLPEGVEADDTYSLVRLRAALDLSSTVEEPTSSESGPADEDSQIVWVRSEGERLAVRCDRVVASQEVVVRPYGDLLRDVPGVSGATTLGDGEAVNVLDVSTI